MSGTFAPTTSIGGACLSLNCRMLPSFLVLLCDFYFYFQALAV
jgi:hypothetical protein